MPASSRRHRAREALASFAPSLALDYVRAPLTLVAQDQQAHAIVEEQVWLHAGASLSLRHRFLLALDVPLLLHEQGEAEPFASGVVAAPGKPALGDPELTLRGTPARTCRWLFARGSELTLPCPSQR